MSLPTSPLVRIPPAPCLGETPAMTALRLCYDQAFLENSSSALLRMTAFPYFTIVSFREASQREVCIR